MKKSLIIFPILFVAWALTSAKGFACDDGDTESRDQVRPVDSRIVYMPYPNGNQLSVVGTLENESKYDLKEVVIEVRYFDDKKQLIDSATNSDYSMVIPANGTTTFRVDTTAAHPEGSYKTHEVVITSATAVKPPKKPNRYEAYAWAWGPFALIMFIFYWFVRRNSRTRSGRSYAEILEESKSVGEATAQSTARIAEALEALAKSKNQ